MDSLKQRRKTDGKAMANWTASRTAEFTPIAGADFISGVSMVAAAVKIRN